MFRSLAKDYNPENIALAKQTLATLARESPDELMRMIETEPLFAAGDEWMDAALAALIGVRPGELDTLVRRLRNCFPWRAMTRRTPIAWRSCGPARPSGSPPIRRPCWAGSGGWSWRTA